MIHIFKASYTHLLPILTLSLRGLKAFWSALPEAAPMQGTIEQEPNEHVFIMNGRVVRMKRPPKS